MLDAYEFCSAEYKKQLEGPRAAWQEAEDRRAGLEKAAKTAAKADATGKDAAEAPAVGATAAPGAAQTPSAASNGAGADVEMKDAVASSSAAAEAGQYAGQLTGARTASLNLRLSPYTPLTGSTQGGAGTAGYLLRAMRSTLRFTHTQVDITAA